MSSAEGASVGGIVQDTLRAARGAVAKTGWRQVEAMGRAA
jgi:hypothetical protein